MNGNVDISGICIETERLILRPWNENDLLDFYEYASVDGVGQMAGWKPHSSLDESRQILDLFISQKKTFALELKESGKVIGSIGLEDRDADMPELDHLFGREVGYVLSKEYWGRGLMTEAVKAVISRCFRELGFDYLTCGHFLHNSRSSRVIEKCGFRYVKDILYTTRMGTREITKLYVLMNPELEK